MPHVDNPMPWTLSHRADQRVRVIADRHYNRQSVGAMQFVPPGRCLVLSGPSAFWITSWPFAEYVRHAWAGAWVCSAFRNEGTARSSDLIKSALSVTRWRWSRAPAVEGWALRRRHDRTDVARTEFAMVTFVNTAKTMTKRDPGRCFRRAGFVEIGETAGGLVALGISIRDMPPAREPHGAQCELFTRSALDVA